MEQKLFNYLSLKQQLKLTTGVYLSLELLQAPVQHLEELVKRELEENPLIEFEEEADEASVKLSPADWDFVFEGGNLFVKEEPEDQPVPSPVDIREELKSQLELELEGVEREVALFMVDNLDERGFLTLSEEEISRKFSLPAEAVRRVRELLKRLSPVGCGSYTLKEAFSVQMEEMGAPEKFIRAVEHLEALSVKERFLSLTGLTEEEFGKFLYFLKRLDPRPGAPSATPLRVVPDLKVKLQGGKVVVEVPTPKLFRFSINSEYLKLMDSPDLKKFIKEKYQRALSLRKALEQRAETLKKLAEVLFDVQREFLKDGKTLNPLTYADLALKVGLHESTVSRAVKDKFVDTPFGVYPMKFFFKKALSGVSTDRVKERIRELIDSEDRRRPLSDGRIAEILKREGIKIARRTVAKYREELGIPPVSKRRVR